MGQWFNGEGSPVSGPFLQRAPPLSSGVRVSLAWGSIQLPRSQGSPPFGFLLPITPRGERRGIGHSSSSKGFNPELSHIYHLLADSRDVSG